jgi:hypothetical protein
VQNTRSVEHADIEKNVRRVSSRPNKLTLVHCATAASSAKGACVIVLTLEPWALAVRTQHLRRLASKRLRQKQKREARGAGASSVADTAEGRSTLDPDEDSDDDDDVEADLMATAFGMCVHAAHRGVAVNCVPPRHPAAMPFEPQSVRL